MLAARNAKRGRLLREDQIRTEEPRLLARAVRQVVAADSPREARHIADARARARLAARDLLFENDRLEPLRRRVDSRRETGGPGAHDRDVVDIRTELRPAADSLDEVGVRRIDVERLRRLAENFLRHVEDGVYPGGCFFASVAAEMDTHPGPVRDLAVQVANGWFVQLESAIRDAQAEGALDPAEDPEQLAFELNAFMLLANAQFVISQESTPINRGRQALERRIAAACLPAPAQ